MKFVLKYSFGKKERNIHKPVETFSPEARRKSTNLWFFQTKVSSINVHLKIQNAVLTILPKIFEPKTEKNYEPKISFKQMIFPKMFLTRWRLHFWQSCRKFFTRSSKELYEPTIFCKQTISLQRLLWKRRILPISFHPTTQQNHEFVCFLKQKNSPTMFLWYVRMQFWQLLWKIFTWSPPKI